MIDDILKEVLKPTHIKVIGTGGAGNNTINRLKENEIDGVELIAANTDAQVLLHINADKKILLGKELTKGLGAGADPAIGEKAAEESASELRKHLEGAEVIFISCGLGGGTGTGSAPIIARIAKELNALTIAVVTLPFKMEGKRRMKNALDGLKKLKEHVDSILVIPNDKLLELSPQLSLNAAFKVADEIITNTIKYTVELINKPGIVNVDLADMRTVLKEKGYAMIGIGESDSKNRAEEAVQNALHNPLLDIDISDAKSALINVIGGPDLSLGEAATVGNIVSEYLSEDATIIWGAMIDENLDKTLRVLVIIGGIEEDLVDKYESIYLLGQKPKPKSKSKIEDIEIDFID
ncbi:MAG: cell division protein FtsZ [Candidatus Woesearchaeota archaeon]